MPTPESPPIAISASQRAILETLSRSRTGSKRDIEQAALVLHLENHPNSMTAKELNCNHLTPKKWLLKWLRYQPPFDAIESSEAPDRLAQLSAAIFDFLADAHRSGAPTTYSPGQYCQMLAICLEDPQDSGDPSPTRRMRN
jgi:hypothetical protein